MRLHNALDLAIRKEVRGYYTAGLQCEEPSCRESSRSLSTHVARDDAGMPVFPACTVPRCKGKMLKRYSDKRLHTQLLFFKTLFDVEWARAKVEADCKRRDMPVEAAATHLEVEDAALLGSLKKQARWPEGGWVAPGALPAEAFAGVGRPTRVALAPKQPLLLLAVAGPA